MSLRLLRKTHFASTEELPGIVLVTIFRTLNHGLKTSTSLRELPFLTILNIAYPS